MKGTKNVRLYLSAAVLSAAALSGSLFANMSPGNKASDKANEHHKEKMVNTMDHHEEYYDTHTDAGHSSKTARDHMSKKHQTVYDNFSRKDRNAVNEAHENGKHPHTKIADILHTDSEKHPKATMSPKHKEVYDNFSSKDQRSVDEAHDNGTHAHTKIADILHEDAKDDGSKSALDQKETMKKQRKGSPAHRSMKKHEKDNNKSKAHWYE